MGARIPRRGHGIGDGRASAPARSPIAPGNARAGGAVRLYPSISFTVSRSPTSSSFVTAIFDALNSSIGSPWTTS